MPAPLNGTIPRRLTLHRARSPILTQRVPKYSRPWYTMYHDRLDILSPKCYSIALTLNSHETLSRGDCPYQQLLSSLGPHLESVRHHPGQSIYWPFQLFELSCWTVLQNTRTNPLLSDKVQGVLSNRDSTTSTWMIFKHLLCQI